MLTMNEICVIERLQLDGFTVTTDDILKASRQVHTSKNAPDDLDDYSWADEAGDTLKEVTADVRETSLRWCERLEAIVRRAHE